jgi:hypothetical protein
VRSKSVDNAEKHFPQQLAEIQDPARKQITPNPDSKSVGTMNYAPAAARYATFPQMGKLHRRVTASARSTADGITVR